MQDLQDLALIIESHIPLVVLETHDEHHALGLLTRVALKTGRSLCSWSITRGLQNGALLQSGDAIGSADGSADGSAEGSAGEPLDLLLAIKRTPTPSIFVLFDFHPYMQGNPAIVRHVKDIALAYARLGHTVIFVSHEMELPPEIKRFSARFDLSLPGKHQLATILREELRSWMSDHSGRRPDVDTEALQSLLANLKGVTAQDARRLLRGAIRDDGAITREDVRQLNKARFELLGLDGLMSYEEDTCDMAAVAGLDNLKQWLDSRKLPFLKPSAAAPGDKPKGLLLTGVQGSGKSLAARAVAGSWNIPLLRLDMGALYNKYIGETEKNLRQCLQQSEQMAPCVLWLDEVEKGIASSGDEEATSRRVLGTLLTWLAERQSAVFLVMTANDISRLPAELMRKGRLDEIFFVDLPLLPIREQIFRVHLEGRHCTPSHFDLAALAARSVDFSGAEIEQAVVAAIHIAMARSLPVSTELIL